MGTRTTYIHNLANTLIGKLRITTAVLGESGVAQSVYDAYQIEIKVELGKMKPATLGKIAACGKSEQEGVASATTPLYYVHCGSWLGKCDSGRALLVEIACTAIVAEMADILMRRGERELDVWLTEGEAARHAE